MASVGLKVSTLRSAFNASYGVDLESVTDDQCVEFTDQQMTEFEEYIRLSETFKAGTIPSPVKHQHQQQPKSVTNQLAANNSVLRNMHF